MDIKNQYQAIRFSSALSQMDHVCCLHFSGNSVFDVMDHLIPAELYIRNNQMLHSLILDDKAHPLADVYVCCDDEDFLVLAEGMKASEIVEYIKSYVPQSAHVSIGDLSQSHRILSLNGPFAWEVLSEFVGPEVVGLPYLTFFHFGQLTCFRAGQTGEYGYDLLIPAADFEKTKERLTEIGSGMDQGTANLEVLDQCALEGWFFNIRREGRENVTPIELQLQWRLSYRKNFIGAEALSERRRKGPRERLTCFIANEQVNVSDTVTFKGCAIGKVVNAGYSHIRKEWVGWL